MFGKIREKKVNGVRERKAGTHTKRGEARFCQKSLNTRL